MSNVCAKTVDPQATPVTEPLIGKSMVENHTGGFVFALDPFAALRRFLILGTEGGTYYMTERNHTLAGVKVVVTAVELDPIRALTEVVEIASRGRALRKNGAIWALAYILKKAPVEVRRLAVAEVPKVCAIGTDILMLAECLKGIGGWSHAINHKAIEAWLFARSPTQLAFQMAKYPNREGWTMRDLLRKVKPKPTSEAQSAVFRWAVKGFEPDMVALPDVLWAIERAKTANMRDLVKLIDEYELPRECIPTAMLNERNVWAALLPHMGMTALIRNLGKMTAVNLLFPLSDATKLVVDRLGSAVDVKSAKLHPLRSLVAQSVYSSGRGMKGSLKWTPVPRITAALEAAFYAGFSILKPTGKKHLVAIDVSGSMEDSMPGSSLSCHTATAALAMMRVRTDNEVHIVGFAEQIIDLGITRNMDLGAAMARTYRSDFGSTHMSAPIEWATANGIEVDVVEIMTDNEVNVGNHPAVALNQYRQRMGRPVKQVVVGMTATDFSIADPEDRDQLDVVGFDSALPEVINSFLEA